MGENGNGDRSTFIWNDDKSAMRLSFQSPWRVGGVKAVQGGSGRDYCLDGGWLAEGVGGGLGKLSDFFIMVMRTEGEESAGVRLRSCS